MTVENELDAYIGGFHLDALTSGVPLNVDLDTTLTVIAGNLYRLLALKLPRYQTATPDKIWRHFLDATGTLHITDNAVTCALNLRSHHPVLIEQVSPTSKSPSPGGRPHPAVPGPTTMITRPRDLNQYLSGNELGSGPPGTWVPAHGARSRRGSRLCEVTRACPQAGPAVRPGRRPARGRLYGLSPERKEQVEDKNEFWADVSVVATFPVAVAAGFAKGAYDASTDNGAFADGFNATAVPIMRAAKEFGAEHGAAITRGVITGAAGALGARIVNGGLRHLRISRPGLAGQRSPGRPAGAAGAVGLCWELDAPARPQRQPQQASDAALLDFLAR